MSVWNEYKWLKCFQHEHRIHQGMPLHVWMYMWATQIKCCNAPRGGPTVQSQHLPPGGQPLQKHCFRYNIYAHANAESHVDTQLQSISFWIDILLDARLNVADYPPTPPHPFPQRCHLLTNSPVSVKQLKTTTPQGLSAWHTRKLSGSLRASLFTAGWKRGQGPLQWLRCAKCQECLNMFEFSDEEFLCRASVRFRLTTWF